MPALVGGVAMRVNNTTSLLTRVAAVLMGCWGVAHRRCCGACQWQDAKPLMRCGGVDGVGLVVGVAVRVNSIQMLPTRCGGVGSCRRFVIKRPLYQIPLS